MPCSHPVRIRILSYHPRPPFSSLLFFEPLAVCAAQSHLFPPSLPCLSLPSPCMYFWPSLSGHGPNPRSIIPITLNPNYLPIIRRYPASVSWYLGILMGNPHQAATKPGSRHHQPGKVFLFLQISSPCMYFWPSLSGPKPRSIIPTILNPNHLGISVSWYFGNPHQAATKPGSRHHQPGPQIQLQIRKSTLTNPAR
ncbi:hypothetical protein B0H14DRAFT_1031572 [Mycena olivaceomarginata]|nr:hypothetical protein B0H14DRAFT_1031572 [Mycena olivaceomarginata]